MYDQWSGLVWRWPFGTPEKIKLQRPYHYVLYRLYIHLINVPYKNKPLDTSQRLVGVVVNSEDALVSQGSYDQIF